MSSRSQVALGFVEHMDLQEDSPVQGILLEVLPLLVRVCAAFREVISSSPIPQNDFVCRVRCE